MHNLRWLRFCVCNREVRRRHFFSSVFTSLFCSISTPDLLQRDPFGEKLITITAQHLNQTQIERFLERMHEYETPGLYAARLYTQLNESRSIRF